VTHKNTAFINSKIISISALVIFVFVSAFCLLGCSGLRSPFVPPASPAQAVPASSDFMAPVTNATDGRGGAKNASIALSIAPQLLRAQDEKLLRDGLRSLLQKKGYTECDRDSFCLAETAVVFSLDPDPSAVYRPYSPSKMICRLSIVDATSRQEVYKFNTGLLWNSDASTTFKPFFERLQSEVPHS
jgi:hypothetical protein